MHKHIIYVYVGIRKHETKQYKALKKQTNMTLTHLEEVDKVFEKANAHLIQVFKQLIKDRNKVSACQLLTKYNSKMMNGECQCTSHFPLLAHITTGFISTSSFNIKCVL